MIPELTAKQQHLLDYLRRKIDRYGSAPSLRKIATDMGISHAAVAQLIRALEAKDLVRREGHYSRTLHLLTPTQEPIAAQRWREIPVVGRITAGLPIYAQQEWGGALVIDGELYRGRQLFALHVIGESMRNAGILDGDLVICEPRQYATNGEIVVALINGEEATVKRFHKTDDHIELRPENPAFSTMHYGFDEVLVQGKVVGVQRGPEGIR